jgi:hypothetical protein
MLQPPLDQLSGGLVQQGDLLIACVKITSYNELARLLSSEPWSSISYQVCSEKGADNLI